MARVETIWQTSSEMLPWMEWDRIAGNTRDEIKNMSKDEISKDFVAMCDLMKLHGNTKFILSMSFVWCIG
jgi:hypothetical protein